MLRAMLFVGIDLATDEDEQQIFDTYQLARSSPYYSRTLEKNYFFGRNDIAEYNSYWLNVFEKD